MSGNSLSQEEIEALEAERGEGEQLPDGSYLFGGAEGLKVSEEKGRFFDFADESSGTLDDLRKRYKLNGHATVPPEAAVEFERERALIGMLLATPSLLGSVEEEVAAHDFINAGHARVFDMLREAEVVGQRADIARVAKALEAAGTQDASAYTARMLADAPMFPGRDEAIAAARQAAREIRQLADAERSGGLLSRNAEGSLLDEPAQSKKSKFGLVMWSEHQHVSPGEEEYEYIIQGLVPAREPVLIYGESQSGKSFITFDMAMSLARGVPFFGRRVLKPLGVVYCAYEAGRGFRDRLRAYRRFHNIKPDETIPFALLTRPIDLWQDENNWKQLVDEIQWIASTRFAGTALGAVVLDTHNAATPGASEIDSKEVGTALRRYHQIREKTGAGLWVVSHKNAEGRVRGNLQLYNRIETAFDISKKVEKKDGHLVPMRDPAGHIIRNFYVKKQREGAADTHWDFVLRGVDVDRIDAYGERVSSCVPTPLGETVESGAAVSAEGKAYVVPPGYVDLKPNAREIFRALVLALENAGRKPPADVRCPSGVTCVQWADWHAERLRQIQGTEEEPKKLYERAKGHLAYARKMWMPKLIGFDKGWYWRTSRKVAGIDDPPAPNAASTAAGEDEITEQDMEEFLP